MILNFTNQDYLERALNLSAEPRSISTLRREDALLLILKDLPLAQIDNLNALTLETGVNLANRDSLNRDEKKRVYDCAISLLNNSNLLGNEVINGTINTSAWISHCLWAGRLCAFLAKEMGLDSEQAEVIGMLHDYGRKVTHTIEHVTKGFEMLSDMGYGQEALGCLTHSFVNGGRCASNETAEEGFYISPEGNPCWKDGAIKDNITLFLESYTYDDYDRILNLADLMASSFGVLSPYNRILDIATRRTIDPTNRGYFLTELISLLAYIADKTNMSCDLSKYADIRFSAKKQTDEMTEMLKEVSAEFFDHLNFY